MGLELGSSSTTRAHSKTLCSGTDRVTASLCVAAGNSFSDSERCVCAGYDNGDIKLFDLRTMTLRWETNAKNGVSSKSGITSYYMIE